MYCTRNNVESKLYIPKPNIEIYRQSFQYAAPKFYNVLPTDITAPSENTLCNWSSSINMFK